MAGSLEHAEQAAVVAWAAYKAGSYPELEMLYAIPNGGHRHKAVAGRMKAEGVKAGVPDLFLAVARWGYHGLYVEMKTQRGRLSDEQKGWLRRLSGQGYLCVVSRGREEACLVIAAYLGIPLDEWEWMSAG